MKTQLVCPFCGEVISEIDSGAIWDADFSFRYAEIERLAFDASYRVQEEAARAHLLARHPIRWRLSRRFRAAMRTAA